MLTDVFRVLYVDDEPGLLEIGKVFLEQTGQFTVDTIGSAPAALALLSETKYDAIISDYHMPKMDGIDFLKKVRSLENTVPFILFTGRGREEVVIQALNEGADFYLQKGGDPQSQFVELSHKIRRAISQKKAETALVTRESYLTAIIENQPGLIWLKDTEGRFLATNEAFARSCGKEHSADVLGKTDLDIWPRELAEKYRADDVRVIGEKKPVQVEEKIFDRQELKWFETFKSPIVDGYGRVIGTTGFSRDITEWKRAELALQESEERFRSFIEQALEGVSIVDEEGRIIEWNTAQENITGIARADALGALAWDLAARMIPDEHRRKDIRSRMKDNILLTIQSGKSPYPEPVYYRFLRPDGSVAVARQTVFVIKTTRGHMIGTLNQDVTEQQHAETMISESEEKFRSLVEYGLESISIIDFSGKGLFTNRATARLLEMDDTTPLAGRSVMEFLSPESQKDAVEDFTRVAGGEDGYLTMYTVTTARGNTIYVECIGKAIRYGGTSAILLSLRDITGRKRAEDALRSANRQLTLLTGITRHDILNKVSVIHGFLKIAGMKNTDPTVGEYLKKIEANTAAIRAEIEFTRVYQDLGAIAPQWLALDEVMPRSHVPQGVSLNADGHGIQVFADPMLERVFFNLLDNSIRHGQRVTEIRVSSRLSGRDLVIGWEDNGVGIVQEEKELIFERGFGKNTGLGMFLAREILALTGIAIRENGEPGKGARFEITVPEGAYRVGGR